MAANGATTAPGTLHNGEINHVQALSDDVGQLFANDDYSDVSLVVQGRHFNVHKVVLASRSEYFRAMLFGGMRESLPETRTIELKDTEAKPFEYLLKYVYTGKVSLQQMKESDLLDLLGLANLYDFQELQSSMSEYLRSNLGIENVCAVFDIANMYSLSSLTSMCLEYMDMNAAAILSHESFSRLSLDGLVQVISRTSFCAQEICIFDAVVQWNRKNPDADIAELFRYIRFALMSMRELLVNVRVSGTVPAEMLLDAVTRKHESKDMDLNYRGYKKPNENVSASFGEVMLGENREALLDGDQNNYDLDHGFTRHMIDEPNTGVVVKLSQACIINSIKMLLWDRDTRSYSYYIQVSMNHEEWVTVIDYTSYLCRSWQTLYFPSKVVRYIKVVGTHNTVNRVFHLVALEAYFSEAQVSLRDNGLIAPTENVATIMKHAFVIEGVSRCRNALINGDWRNYDWDSGYTCHQLNSGAIVVQLAQPYIIDSMKLLLWDCDERSYSYVVSVSVDNTNWFVVVDKSDEPCRSWEYITFAPRAASFIKIVGTRNTANEVFHCVHFECPARSADEAGTNQGPATASSSPPVRDQPYQDRRPSGGLSIGPPAASKSRRHTSAGDLPGLGGMSDPRPVGRVTFGEPAVERDLAGAVGGAVDGAMGGLAAPLGGQVVAFAADPPEPGPVLMVPPHQRPASPANGAGDGEVMGGGREGNEEKDVGWGLALGGVAPNNPEAGRRLGEEED